MDKLIRSLPAIIKASGGAEEVTEAACIAAWREAVGPVLSDHAIPVRLQNQTMVVVVADAVWKRQLEHMRGQLLFRLNMVLGQSLVKLIELQVDAKTVELECAKRADANTERSIDYKIPAELLAAAAAIEDCNLRRAFLGAAASCVKRLGK
ncbi:MAG TPA: DUF721 domain-containing protein [Pyrinomonadaceae bacterium]|nr:DUF721 domain-containing protein [Pyrinomonadaceae bacterium]